MIKRRNALDWRKSFVWEWLVDRAQPVVSQWNTSQVTTNDQATTRQDTTNDRQDTTNDRQGTAPRHY